MLVYWFFVIPVWVGVSGLCPNACATKERNSGNP
jgi:hypothetical protein